MAEGETTGVPDEHTRVATSDNEEITGVPDTEADDMTAIDSAIEEVSATLYQELRDPNTEPEETELPESARDAEATKNYQAGLQPTQGKVRKAWARLLTPLWGTLDGSCAHHTNTDINEVRPS